MTEIEHDLPEELVEWIAQVGQGEITHIHRHVARREAWVVDITRKDGVVPVTLNEVDFNLIQN